jgi:hypothetical protein
LSLPIGWLAERWTAQGLLDRQDLGVALIAHVVEALVVVGARGEDVAVAAMGGPFGAVEQQNGVRLELRIDPGVVRDVAVDVVVVVGDGDEVEPDLLGEADDLPSPDCWWIPCCGGSAGEGRPSTKSPSCRLATGGIFGAGAWGGEGGGGRQHQDGQKRAYAHVSCFLRREGLASSGRLASRRSGDSWERRPGGDARAARSFRTPGAGRQKRARTPTRKVRP